MNYIFVTAWKKTKAHEYSLHQVFTDIIFPLVPVPGWVFPVRGDHGRRPAVCADFSFLACTQQGADDPGSGEIGPGHVLWKQGWEPPWPTQGSQADHRMGGTETRPTKVRVLQVLGWKPLVVDPKVHQDSQKARPRRIGRKEAVCTARRW